MSLIPIKVWIGSLTHISNNDLIRLSCSCLAYGTLPTLMETCCEVVFRRHQFKKNGPKKIKHKNCPFLITQININIKMVLF
jgi:hypothetical protein